MGWRRYKPHLLPVLLLLLATFVLYGKALNHEFIANWDDYAYVAGNQDIMGFTREHLAHAFTRYYGGNYAPLHIIYYMLDYTLWGLNSSAFKLTNITLHALNTLLYYALLVRITGRRLLALAAAAVFLCHPVQVETVVWISQSKNLLAMFFFLISFQLYLNWKERRRFVFYALSLAAFVLALLSKSVALILPLIFVCHDLCFRKRETLWRLVQDKLPYLALGMACAVVAFYSQGENGGRTGYLGGAPLITLLNMLPVFSRYLIMLFVPAQLSIIYNSTVRTALDTEIFLSAMLIVIVMAGLAYLYRRNRGLFFWSSLFFIGLLPVSNIIPMITLMNDRYLYFPMLGFAAFIAHFPILKPGALPLHRSVTHKVLFAAVLLILSMVTWKRIDVWHDSITLWSDAVAKAQEGSWYGADRKFIVKSFAEALTKRGYQAQQEGAISTARYYYQKALVYDPNCPSALNNLGGLLMIQGKILAGRAYLIRLTKTYLHNDMGFDNLGLNYQLSGELDKAEENFKMALKINPGNNFARNSLKEISGQRHVLMSER